MITYILDSNILIYLVGENVKIIPYVKEKDIFGVNAGVISCASVGESLAFSMKKNWGIAKKGNLETLLKMTTAIPIFIREIAGAYAEIDAFSQGRHPTLISTFTTRNMGKNDLWIAATTHLSKGTLLTTDNDFDHLMPHFLTIQKIDT